ncbi:MAG: GlcNAc-PI de-N-acetylase [Bacteroidetes bacterium GWF2_42_66]|nr:MAG: GlcNAc-PI de-N-acetylase [Bacteroidetes bacterium GWA2_42_15]OFX98784.1 MAG: GlcNAc-PI de-N-acetylase [Bacteroidetes bacterium GWE2_42_39]OFY43019.1 MAG: GlcNAc-PI de-N-acetylase [Bacteroidetes bacterium GWF2_42_66]HBL77144.1 GlcNAc-PI de-N-acetylase [Prolixibacteraceae bacterium]HCR91435.1 GlcNAc-PI de-N-acetylase [Prolixibacteraceae bacterium]
MKLMKIIFFLIMATSVHLAFAQDEKLNIVVIGAHPDDADLLSGGTAIKFARLGHHVLFVSLTNGDAGHYNKGGGALAKIRMAEAEEAGNRFGVTYRVLDNHDGELMPVLNVRLEVIRLIREWDADVVIGHRPNDYHPDHRNAAILVQDAAFMVVVPNIAPDTPALNKNPIFLYAQDRFQKPYPFQPDIAVDISDVFEQKVYAFSAHRSQFFEWLPWIGGILDEVPEDESKKLEWLAAIRKKPVTPAVRESLIKWYGEDKGNKITDAEAFEICEYGRHPDEKEIKQLFPMLGN